MSRTTQVTPNPATKFLKWKSTKDEKDNLTGGSLCWYDKETKQNNFIELPLKFALLNAEMVCITGFHDESQSNIWSNEVKSPDGELIVRCKTGVLHTFKRKDWKHNKEKIEGFGGKLTSSLYIAVEEENGWELQNIHFNGANNSGGLDRKKEIPEEDVADGWWNFSKIYKNKLFSNFIEVDGYKLKKNGAVKYTMATLKVGDAIPADLGIQFDNMDKELKKYLSWYFNKPKDEADNQTDTETEVESKDSFVS